MTDEQIITPADVAVVPLVDPEIERYIASLDAVTAEDPEEVAMNIVKRILAAETVDEVLSKVELTHARDLLHTPLEVLDVRWNEGAYGGTVSKYAVVQAVNIETGEPVTFSCGGQNVMAQLYQLRRLGALPAKVQIVEAGKQTARGYRPLWLEPVPADF